MARNSPPVDIPANQPVEEETVNSPSQLIPATTSNASLKQFEQQVEDRPSEQVEPPSLSERELPKLEPAEPASKVSRKPEDSLAPTSLEPDATTRQRQPLESPTKSLKPHRLYKPSSIGQKIGKNDDDLRIFKSSEFGVLLSRSKFLQGNSKKGGHSWTQSISVDVSGKKPLIVRIYLFPKVSEKNHEEIAMLYVMSEVSSTKLRLLNAYGEECWVLLETELMDQIGGQRLGCMDFTPRAVNMNDGQLNFYQDLVQCDEVKSCNSDSLNLLMKVTFITCPTGGHDGFINVEMPTADDK